MNTFVSTGRRGIALVMSLAILAVVGALVLGSILTTQLELAVSRNDIAVTQAQYLAQAGLQTTKARLFQTYRYVTSEEGSTDPCASAIDTSIDFNRDGSSLFWVNDLMSLGNAPVYAPNGDLIGFYEVDLLRDPTRNNVITIRSEGRRTLDPTDLADPLATSRAFATFSISTGSGVEQAIFAGSGSAMGLINGNAEVYGGIYIEGDRVAYEDIPSTQPVVFAANGTFRQFNGYDSTVLASGNYNPADFLAETDVPNLCASFRIGFGSVAVGSSVELGKPDNKLYSVAVGQDGANVTYNGAEIVGDVDDTCKKNRGVCSQEGVTGFDLIDVPRFPRFDEPPANTDLCNGATTWRTCIRNEAEADGIVIAFDAAGDLDSSLVTGLSPECVVVLEGARAATNRSLVLGSTDLDCRNANGDGFTYSYSGSRGSFTAYGDVNVRGLNLVFDVPTSYRIEGGRTNAGLSLESVGGAGGNVRINSDFVPGGGAKYPQQVLALVAEHVVTLNGGNNTTVAAPLYAGDLFRMRANSTLVGQVIADSFCSMGNSDTNDTTCNTGGAPPRIIYAAAGGNRPASYQAVATPGGTPTYKQLGYEQR